MQQFSLVNGRRVINVYSKHFARRFNPEWMRLDNQAVRVAMRRGVGEFFRSAGKEKAVIGLSGGLDSSVSAQMVVESLGRDNVVGVAMPYGEEFTKTTDWLYASMLARWSREERGNRRPSYEALVDWRDRRERTGGNTRLNRGSQILF